MEQIYTDSHLDKSHKEECRVCEGSGKDTSNKLVTSTGTYYTPYFSPCWNCKGKGWITVIDYDKGTNGK